MTDLDPPEDCMWCAGNGRLETYTIEGDVDESTACVCVVGAERDAALAERDEARALHDTAVEMSVKMAGERDAALAELDVARDAYTNTHEELGMVQEAYREAKVARDAALAECERLRKERDAVVAFTPDEQKRRLHYLSADLEEAIAARDAAVAKAAAVHVTWKATEKELAEAVARADAADAERDAALDTLAALVESQGDAPK